MKIKRSTFIPVLAAALVLGACQSMGTRVVESVKEEGYRELERYEEEIVAQRLSPNAGELARMRRELEELAGRENLDKPYRARVLGLYGEAEWLAGREAAVRRTIQAIEATWRGEARLYVLQAYLAPEGARLGILERGLQEADRPALVQLHLGERYLALGRYAPAAAAFDEAFAGLPRGYRELYGEKRDLAFRMRDREAPASGTSTRALELAELTAEAMLQLTLGETSFLDHLVPRGTASMDRLLPQLLREEVLPPSVSSSRNLIRRGEAAFFVSRLVAWLENDPGLLQRYSEIYGRSGASPVPDVSLRSPYFDAVLGLVEREIFELPDGIHFFPDLPVSGLQFYTVLARMKALYR